MFDIPLDQLPYDPSPEVFFNGDNHLVEITQSAMQTYLRCPQKFVFRYMMLLSPKGLYIPFVVGSAVHNGFETLLAPTEERALTDTSRLEDSLRATDKLFHEMEERPDLTIGREQKIDHARAVASACMEAWWIVWADEFSKYKFVRTEWNVRSREGATLSSPMEERMAGKLDGVLQTLANGTHHLLENKTRAQIGDIDVVSLELDLQALWYFCVYDVHQRLYDTSLPDLEGFLYNAIQKPQHRLSAAGWEDLKSRMLAAMVEDPRKYFRLEPITVSKKTTAMAMENFRRIVSLLDNIRSGNIIKNLTSCNDYGGCPYRTLCFNRADANNPAGVLETPGIELYSLTEPHPELDDIGP